MSIYLDYNASAPLLPVVRTAMIEAMPYVANPSSVHTYGRRSRDMLAACRKALAGYCGADERHITFTSGGTEANMLVHKGRPWNAIIVPVASHASLHAKATHTIERTEKGTINLAALEALLSSLTGAVLVSVMGVHNETGVREDIQSIVDLSHYYGAQVHVDHVQSFGKVPLQKADFITLSAHKCGGPQGVGAVITEQSFPLPLMEGGGQEGFRRSGTPNVLAIHGLWATLNAFPDLGHVQELRCTLEKELRVMMPDVYIAGENGERACNTTFFADVCVKRDIALMHLDLKGIAISTGSACSSGTPMPSKVLQAMQAPIALWDKGVRVSLGWGTTHEHIMAFLTEWRNYMRHVQ